MNLDEVSRWRNRTGRMGALLCVVLLLSALDGLVGRFREQPDLLRTLPGDVMKVNGSLRGDISDLDRLQATSSSAAIRLRIDQVHSGFWLGGSMWRGVMEVEPQAAPGEYQLAVTEKGAPGQKPFTIFTVRVFPDAESHRRSSKSYIQRYLGFSPWWVFAACLPLTLASFAVAFYLAHRREALLSERGMAEIYKVAVTPDGFAIAFGLGARDGLQNGSRLTLLDGNLQPVGTIEVHEVAERDASALLPPDARVQPGYLVARQ